MTPTSSDRAAFLGWARQSLTPLATVAADTHWKDLEALGAMIGDARVVALGEGDHFGAEPMLFRNRLLQYLVEQKGFTAVAIESGTVESRAVYNYVRDGSGDLATAVANGISWTFDKLPQNHDLVRWLRQFNADPRCARKVNFYGFDVPGSPSNPHANRGVDTALVETLQFLERVDREAAATFHERIDRLLPNLRFDLYSPTSAPGYHRLSQTERDVLTSSVADLVALLEAREAPYTAATSLEDYQWALRAAIGARQVDGWLRQCPLEWQATSEQQKFLDVASDLRDRAQADNLEWIFQREGPSGKILVYAHNGHLSTAAVKWRWCPLGNGASSGGAKPGVYLHTVAGTYLRRRYGDQLFVIGNLIGGGSIGCQSFSQELPQVAADSLDGLAKDVGMPLFLLNLHTAPADVAGGLNQERQIGHGFKLPPNYQVLLELPARGAFDAVFYLDTVTPACDPTR